jgi:hypothetical protein
MKQLALVMLVACGTLAPKSEDTLTESIRSYNEGVRWSRFQVAAVHVPPPQRAQFVDDWDERVKDLKITDYEVVKVDQPRETEAHVEVKMEWYMGSEGKVHETRAVQTWEKRGKMWFVVDESRLRGTEMPGLPEPLMKD